MNHIERAQKRIVILREELRQAQLAPRYPGDGLICELASGDIELLEWATALLSEGECKLAPAEFQRGLHAAARRIVDTLAPEVE